MNGQTRPNPTNYDLSDPAALAHYQADTMKFQAAQSAAAAGATTVGPGATTPRPARNLDTAPNPAQYDMESISGQAQFNADMTNFQQRLGAMQNFWKALSDTLKGQSDVQAKIAGNFR